MTKALEHVAHPFVKWAGGKRQLIPQMEEYLPQNYIKYIEPFVGGGALFFHIKPKTAVLIDTNEDLINCYNVIKNNLSELIRSLKKHKNEKEYYYQVRSADREIESFKKWTNVEKASRTIFMNRCCYNGLYRVNSKGEFNTPFGSYKNPKFCNEVNLNAVHETLKSAQLIQGSFETCLKYAEKDDFVYFDPPYHPLSETANFTSYTKDSFGKDSQIKLLEVFKQLDERGCKVMLSNSYNEFILDLYEGFKIITLNAKRAINSDASKRGKIKEILVLNNFD